MTRRFIVITFLITLFSLFLSSENLIKDLRQLILKKEFAKAHKLIDSSLEKSPGNNTLRRIKIDVYLEAGEKAKALVYIEKELKKDQKKSFMMSEKLRVSLMSRDYNEALEVALAIDKRADKKTAADSFMIARIYLKQLEPDEAMVWLNESAERGFIDYMVMRSAEFKPLHKRADFLELVGKMKLAAGLGNPAKPFTINSMVQKSSVSLSHYKGKVVVLMFTGSWSRACYIEVKALAKEYLKLREKGVEIIEINLDTKMKYLEKQKRPWIMAASLKGWNDPVAKLYGVKSVPAIWVIDKKGYIRSFGIKGKELLGVLDKLSAE